MQKLEIQLGINSGFIYKIYEFFIKKDLYIYQIKLIPSTGVEPASHKALNFESSVSTISPRRKYFLIKNLNLIKGYKSKHFR